MYIFPACFNVIDNFPKVKHNKKVNVKFYFFYLVILNLKSRIEKNMVCRRTHIKINVCR